MVHVADGTDSLLHAKVSASMTVTFAEIVPAPEQPYAETFIYSAIRKTLDQGQLELLKSGNRQPVPVTTRYYSRWQKKFFFTDTDDESPPAIPAAKVFWLSGVLGNSQPVWIADPRDAQYLNTTAEDLVRAAAVLADGWTGDLERGEDGGPSLPPLRPRCWRAKPSFAHVCSRLLRSPSRLSTRRCAPATPICKRARRKKDLCGAAPDERKECGPVQCPHGLCVPRCPSKTRPVQGGKLLICPQTCHLDRSAAKWRWLYRLRKTPRLKPEESKSLASRSA